MKEEIWKIHLISVKFILEAMIRRATIPAVFITILVLFTARVSAGAEEALVIPVEGKIDHGMAGYVERSLDKHERNSPVILRIDTFGGRVNAALQIVEVISNASRPVYALIKKKAWSAGALISLACDEIAFLKGASMGSATPVSSGGKKVPEKYVSAIRAEFRSLAEKNGYPPSLAEAMVDKEIEVFHVRVDQQEDRYLTDSEIQSLKNQGHSISKKHVYVKKGKLLNLSFDDAETVGFSSGTYETFSNYLQSRNISPSSVVEAERTWSETLVTILQHQAVIQMLMIIAMFGIYAELKAPGIGIFGAIGISALMIVYFSQYLVGMAGYMELLLLLIGVTLIGIEIFMLPGLGWAGIPGTIVTVAGLFLMFTYQGIPTQPWEFDQISHGLFTLVGGMGLGILVIFLLSQWLPEGAIFGRMALHTTIDTEQSGERTEEPPEEADEPQEGVAITELDPSGKIRVDGKKYDARADGPYIDQETDVRVVGKELNNLIVEPK